MHKNTLSILLGIALALSSTLSQAVQVRSFNTSFSASENLFQGSPFPPAGFNESFNTGGSIGFSGSVKANTGTATANVNGSLSATYDEMISAGSATSVKLNYNGGSSSFGSDFGAKANLSAFVNASPCILPNPFGGCIKRVSVNKSFTLAEMGFLLEPGTNFTDELSPSIVASASDSEDVPGAAAAVSIPLLGDIGPRARLIVDQDIDLTTTSINGLLRGVNRRNGDTLLQGFNIGSSEMTTLGLAGMDTGIWDFSILDLDLFGRFYNAATLALKLDIAIPIISDFDLAQFNIVTLSNNFAMDFSKVSRENLFSILVTPIPAAVWLFGTALVGFIGFARRRSIV